MGNILQWLSRTIAYNNFTEERKNDGKSMFYIHQAMHESILPRVATTINIKQAWDTLEIAYQGLDKVRTSKMQILRRDFESLSMKESDSFYTRVVGLINQLKSHGENIEHRRVVEKVQRNKHIS